MSYSLIRKALFTLPTETSHHLSLASLNYLHRLGLLNRLFPKPDDRPVELMGIRFPNPVGLAAGLDKDGDAIDALGALGFGFIELGTVTPRPQPGNPSPRLFRLPGHQAIINRMGFNNKGIDHLLNQIEDSEFEGVLGINIGKNYDTPVEKALDDYLIGLRKAYPHATYITVNVSSPNTPGLRQLQYGDALADLLVGLKDEQKRLADKLGYYRPLAIKIAPDMSDDELKMVADIVRNKEMDALIATNTTLARDKVAGARHANESGGLSGAPLTDMAQHCVQVLAAELQGEIPIIGVGGIMDSESALQRLNAGADLIQLYTGFIYEGPSLIRSIVESL